MFRQDLQDKQDVYELLGKIKDSNISKK